MRKSANRGASRRTRRLGVGAALALALVAGVAPLPASAAAQKCSCLVNSENDQLASADVVFKGTLDGTTSSASRERGGEVHESGLVHQFTPSELYKGAVGVPQYVVEPPEDAGCGVAWEGEGPYLVFAERPSKAEQKKYELAATDLLLKPCGGTRQIDADDEPSFGPGKPVVAQDRSAPADPAPTTAPPKPAAPPAEPVAPADPADPANPLGDGPAFDSLDLAGLISGLLEALLGGLDTDPGDGNDGFSLIELGNLGNTGELGNLGQLTPPAGEPGGSTGPGAPAAPGGPEITAPDLGGLPIGPPPA